MTLKMNCLSVGYNSKSKISLLCLGNSSQTSGPDRDKSKRPLCRRCNNAKYGKRTTFRSAQEKKCCKHLSVTPGSLLTGCMALVLFQKSYRRKRCKNAEDAAEGDLICQRAGCVLEPAGIASVRRGGNFWQHLSEDNPLRPHQLPKTGHTKPIQRGKHVVVKIIRSYGSCSEAAYEVLVLEYVKALDPGRTHSGTVTAMRCLQCILMEYYLGAALFPEFMTCQNSDHKNLFDLVQKMLDYIPNKHCSYRAALSFLLSVGKQKEGTGSCS